MDDELELININDVDLLRTLEQRTIGNCKKSKGSPYELQIHAEDVFIHKEFDELRCEIPDTPRSTFLMVFSPDGTKIASTHGNHNIYVTDSRTGKNIRTLSGHPRTPWCIAFHPTSNQILASGCLGGQVRIWDLSVSLLVAILSVLWLVTYRMSQNYTDKLVEYTFLKSF